MRPIDADKLRDWIKAEANPYGAPTLDYDSGLKVLNMIDRMPTIEPENDWKPFRLREMTEEERKEHRGEKYMWADPMPEDGQEILVSDGKYVWEDVFCDDGEFCYLESHDYIYEGMAWMPKPKPHKAKEVKE